MDANKPLEVELDSRQRLPLGRIVQPHQQRFRVSVLASGEYLLTPVVSIPERELAMLRNPQRPTVVPEGREPSLGTHLLRRPPTAEIGSNDEVPPKVAWSEG